MTTSINGLDKAAVLAALYNNAKLQGLDILSYEPQPMTVAGAQHILDNTTNHYFDSLFGRALKIDLNKLYIQTWFYNRDNGASAAEQVIAALRTQEATP